MSGKYTTAFGAIIDDEISGALRGGMQLESIYIELLERTRELQQAIVTKHTQRQEASPCFAD